MSVEPGAKGPTPSAPANADSSLALDADSRSRDAEAEAEAEAEADAGTVGGLSVESGDGGLNPSALRDALVTLAIESWRISQTFSRLLEKLEPKAQGRYAGQIRWFSKKAGEALDQAQLRLVNIEGQAYDPGMAATALNMD